MLSEDSVLFVAGDARIPFLSLRGSVGVGSELDAGLFACAGERAMGVVGGALRCDLLLSGGGTTAAEAVSVRHADDSTDVLKRFFPDELLAAGETGASALKVDELFERLRNGEKLVDLSVD